MQIMHAISSLTKREQRRLLGDCAFILPQFALFVGLTILPFFVAIPVLLTDRETFLDSHVRFIGLQNLTALFRDPDIWAELGRALWRTTRFAAGNYVAVYLFGMVLALLMYEIGFKGGFFTVIYLPMMVSGLAIGYLALMLFSRSSGTANLLLLKLGWLQKPLDIRQGSGTQLLLPLVVGWQYAGFNMAIFLSGLLNIPKETIEAAIVDGASYQQRLFQVYFPQMLPSFIIATIMCLIGSFGIFDHVAALGGMAENPEAQFLAVYLFRQAFARQRLALGMTLAVETGVPLAVAGILLQRLQAHLRDS